MTPSSVNCTDKRNKAGHEPTTESPIKTAVETIKSKVHQTNESQWRQDIETKSSLKYLNPEVVRVGKVHQIYSSVRDNIHDVRRAKMKARFLTGTYTLQSNRARFN